MGVVCKLVDAILFIFFLLIAIAAPLFDAQSCLPLDIFPAFLVDLNLWYIREFGDYLSAEKPHFFLGLVWLQLLFQWPLAIANLYAIIANKSWFKTTCLIYGVSVFTAMIAILAELKGSRKASDKLMMVYFPFLGLAVLAILRGLLPHSSKPTSNNVARSSMARKKRA